MIYTPKKQFNTSLVRFIGLRGRCEQSDPANGEIAFRCKMQKGWYRAEHVNFQLFHSIFYSIHKFIFKFVITEVLDKYYHGIRQIVSPLKFEVILFDKLWKTILLLVPNNFKLSVYLYVSNKNTKVLMHIIG